MMKKITGTLLLLLAALLPLFSAEERVGVAEIQCRNGVKADEVAGFTDYIESKLSRKYQLVSRSAMPAMKKEWEFNQSGWVLPEEQRTELAQKSISKLLVCTVSKTQNRYLLTLLLVDSLTGKADPLHRASTSANSTAELYRRLDSVLSEAKLLDAAPASKLKKLALLPATSSRNDVSRDFLSELTNRLGEFLLKNDCFEILSREDLRKIAAESKIAETDLADPAMLSKIGRLQLGDYILVTEVQYCRNRVKATSTAIAGTSLPRYLTDISLRVQIIEVATGRILSMENVNYTLDSRSIPAEIRRDWIAENYQTELIKRVAKITGTRIVDTLDPLTVVSMEGNTVYLSRGENSGIAVGTVYRLFSQGKVIRHPRTGKLLGNAEQMIGTLKVTSVSAQMAAGEIVKSTAPVKAGTLCRLPADNSSGFQQEAPAYPMAQ